MDCDFLKSLECPVCIQFYKEPKTLPCGHSLCSLCVNHLFDTTNQRKDYVVRCPVCRREYARDLSSIPLPSNYVLKGIVSRYTEMREGDVKCISCEKSTPSEQQMICEHCAEKSGVLQVFCVSCAVNNHANCGHRIGERAIAFADVRNEAIGEVAAAAKKIRENIAHLISSVNFTAKYLQNVKMLSDKVEVYDGIINDFSNLPLCTTAIAKKRIDKMERLTNTLDRLFKEYESFLVAVKTHADNLNELALLTFKSLTETNCEEDDFVTKFSQLLSPVEMCCANFFDYSEPKRLTVRSNHKARKKAAVYVNRKRTITPEKDDIEKEKENK